MGKNIYLTFKTLNTMGFSVLYSRQREKELAQGTQYDAEGNELVQWCDIFDWYASDGQDSFDVATNRGANSQSIFNAQKQAERIVKEKQIGGMY
jgi:hypothetical protein